ncbi:TonB-dependent receptor [bacterium DOLZORAL124_64_63]|nr:MAG: TonB-dependent receptor [bacterium DOLZORAL124_64_63]
MKRQHGFLLVMSLSLLLLTGLAPARAMDSSAMETVTVTAAGTAMEDLATPHMVTVVDQGRISEVMADNLGSLLMGLPGVAAHADGAWGVNPVVRGLKKEQIVILVDGVRLSSAQPYGAIASLVDLGQIERVEIVRGPASLLYGSGALGGVINFITRKSDFRSEPGVNGRYDISTSTVDDAVRGGLALGLSNSRHALDARVSGKDVGDYESPEGKVPHSSYSQMSVSAGYRLKLGERGLLTLDFQRQQDDDVWYPGSAKPHMAHGVQTIHSPEQKRTLLKAGFETGFGTGLLRTLKLTVHRQDVDRTINAFSANLQRDVVRTDVRFRTTGGRASLEMVPAAGHLLTVGMDAWVTEGDPARYMDTNPPAFDNNMRNDPFSEGRLQSFGAFVQDTYLVEDWSFKAGLRLDNVRGDAEAASGLPAGTDLEHSDGTASWSLGAVRNFSEGANPYLNIGRAYRAADMRERFESSPRGDGYLHQGNPQLKPELSTTVELGFKGSLGAYTYRVAGYHSRIEDYIFGRDTGITHPGTGLPIKKTENLAEVRLTGFEASVDRSFGRRYSAFLDLSYVRGENRYDDEPMAEIPPFEATLGCRRSVPKGWIGNLAVRMVAKQDRVGTVLTNGTEDATEGFVTTSIGLGFRFAPVDGRWGNTLRLSVANLFDENYHEHLTIGVSGWEPQAPGRNVRLAWQGEF